MEKLKITVMTRAQHPDLIKQYESPNVPPCEMNVGDSFIVENCQKPESFCDEAWKIIYPYAKELSEGGGNFFDGWMKNKKSAMLSCNDGFRPVTYYIEVIE